MLYILRAHHFVYHDDIYRWAAADERSRIAGVFYDQASAKQAWMALEHATITRRPLNQIADYVEIYPKKLEQLDAWVHAQCGRHIIDDTQCEQTLADLTAEQLFDFLQQARLCSWEIHQVPDNTPFYLCWVTKTQRYLTTNCDNELDAAYPALMYAHQPDELLARYIHDFNLLPYGEVADNEGAFEQYGTLAEISHQPEQLQQLLDTHSGLRYYAQSKTLLMDYDAQLLQQVYPLLKHPPLDIRPVSVEQLCSIQQQYDSEVV